MCVKYNMVHVWQFEEGHHVTDEHFLHVLSSVVEDFANVEVGQCFNLSRNKS